MAFSDDDDKVVWADHHEKEVAKRDARIAELEKSAFSVLEIGFLMAYVIEPRHRESQVARALYFKLKAAAIALGVDWSHYGDPKEWEEKKP